MTGASLPCHHVSPRGGVLSSLLGLLDHLVDLRLHLQTGRSVCQIWRCSAVATCGQQTVLDGSGYAQEG